MTSLAIANKVAQVEAAKAKERQKRKPSDSVPVNCPEQNAGRETRDIAAKKAGFSSGTEYDRAKKVVKQGSAELVRALDAGKVAVSTAAKLADLPKAKQTKAVKGGRKAIKKALAPKSQPREYPVSDLFCKALSDVIASLSYVHEEHGTMPKMFASKKWDKGETQYVRQAVVSLAKTFADLKKEIAE